MDNIPTTRHMNQFRIRPPNCNTNIPTSNVGSTLQQGQCPANWMTSPPMGSSNTAFNMRPAEPAWGPPGTWSTQPSYSQMPPNQSSSQKNFFEFVQSVPPPFVHIPPPSAIPKHIPPPFLPCSSFSSHPPPIFNNDMAMTTAGGEGSVWSNDRNRSRSSDRRSGRRSRSNESRVRRRSRSNESRSKRLSQSKESRSRRRSRSNESRSKRRSRSNESRVRRRSRSNDRRRRRSRSLDNRNTRRSRSTESRRQYSYRDSRRRSRSRESRRTKRRSKSNDSRRRTPESRGSRRVARAPDNYRWTPNGHQSGDDRRRSYIEKWACGRSATEMTRSLQEEATVSRHMEREVSAWIRSAPDDLFYNRDPTMAARTSATPRCVEVCDKFKCELVDKIRKTREEREAKHPPLPRPKRNRCMHTDLSCSSSEDESDSIEDVNQMMEELQRKQRHPYRLHPELWFNDPGEMNDGPLCRCSAKARRSGIRHGFYPGETISKQCDPLSNNVDRLYHYKITISPPNNFLTRTPTIILHDDHEFIFEGFSLFSHYRIQKLPVCKVIRFNIEYIIVYIEEKFPENFVVQECDLFYEYFFKEILELRDLELRSPGDTNDGCLQYHVLPRFIRELPDNGRELLPMSVVLRYLLTCNRLLIDQQFMTQVPNLKDVDWESFAESLKGMVVVKPGMKPCAIRVDQLDRHGNLEVEAKQKELPNIDSDDESSTGKEVDAIKKEPPSETEVPVEPKPSYPEIIHFGIRPPQLSYAGNPEYQKAWRAYVKFRHLLANMPKPTTEDKEKLAAKESRLHSMRNNSKMKRDVTVTVSSEGFYTTGLMCDVVQHAMLLPVLVCHLRFHRCLAVLEDKIGYTFSNRFLLQLALTHPSYRENFGTNPDHARNSLTNCGIRTPQYGDRRIHYINTRKRGINTLINIMSKFGAKDETESNIYHNERLEFLGDAVVEFITSIHLFYLFRDLEEGGLATYRAALVQNQHLALLAKELNLDAYMLYAHGSDLCHDLELRHAMANCFEALMGALFLDGGIDAPDKVFGNTLFAKNKERRDLWFRNIPHVLQEQEPMGDRKWIEKFPILQNLLKFEKMTGIKFKHIRLLARAFTDRSIGFTNLTLGSNQRLEFLGDSVLQLIASEYLYKFFPEHHEGHLSLLRSSLVNNKTQSVVSDDLGMSQFAMYANPKAELKIKDKADLLEAFLGALYVDYRDLGVCKVFCDVCFFPRLQTFIMNQDWNDPKSKLQQCCLTLRSMEGGEPDIPVYKVVECKGPTNTRVYTVAVYFRNERLAEASGHSIQQAEMNAALNAIKSSETLFPQLDYQKRVIEKSLKSQVWPERKAWGRHEGESKRKRRNEGKSEKVVKSRDKDSGTETPDSLSSISQDNTELQQKETLVPRSSQFEESDDDDDDELEIEKPSMAMLEAFQRAMNQEV